MNNIKLFDLCELSLPDSIEVEMEGEGELQQYYLGDKNEQGGVLSVKRMQWSVPEEDKRNKMLDSIFVESDMAELSDSVHWGMEELVGEEDGEKVAITRWLVACLKSAPRFDLFIFSYTAAVSAESREQTNNEIKLFEEAIHKAVWI